MTVPAKPSASRRRRVQTDLARTRRARRIHRILADTYPQARCELDYRNPFELLVATVLSAQCTDARVNQVTPALFARYPTPSALAGADPTELEELIRPTGFFRAKAANLRGLGHRLTVEYDEVVPPRLDDLVTLPGVGRKTANVVLGNTFGIPGLTVDTHVGRLSRRMGFTDQLDPVKVEFELAALFPPADWTMLCHRLIFHGRRICHSRKPACGACPVQSLCPSWDSGETDPVRAAAMVKDATPQGGPE